MQKLIDDKIKNLTREFAIERIDVEDYDNKQELEEDIDEEINEIEAHSDPSGDDNYFWDNGYIAGYEQAMRDNLIHNEYKDVNLKR